MRNTISTIILLFALSVLVACSKTSSKTYTANYVINDSVIRFIGFITVDTAYSMNAVTTISLDSTTNQLRFRNASYSLQAGTTNTFGTYPGDIIVLTKDSINISYTNPAVPGGNGFIILKGYKH